MYRLVGWIDGRTDGWMVGHLAIYVYGIRNQDIVGTRCVFYYLGCPFFLALAVDKEIYGCTLIYIYTHICEYFCMALSGSVSGYTCILLIYPT